MLICGVQLEVVPTEKLQISQNPPNILWQMITVDRSSLVTNRVHSYHSSKRCRKKVKSKFLVEEYVLMIYKTIMPFLSNCSSVHCWVVICKS